MDNETCLLKKVEEQELEAKKFGFYWESLDQLLDQVKSECKEIEEAWERSNNADLEEEVGDLIQAAISLAVFCKLDPRKTLLLSIEKFQKRYEAVMRLAREDGLEHFHLQTFEKMMEYWNRAKAATKS
jgi:uncharacterized protein YabN with tetrapyrrole methylase and pyrophosphatase domain